MNIEFKNQKIRGDLMFKKGDVVALKSGGPRMTVDEIKDGQIICYLCKNGDFEKIGFSPELLMLDDEEASLQIISAQE